jgi:hypothetical protein
MPRRRDVKKNGCSKYDEEWFKHGQKNDWSTHDPKRRRMVKKKKPEGLFKQEALPKKKKRIVKKQNFAHNTPTAHNNAHHRTCVCSARFCACTTPSAVV